MAEYRAELWSDFDGTAVEHFGLLDSRNWLKSDLPLMPGYLDFLRAVRAEGVEIGGIITRRAELFRGSATMKSIVEHGLGEFFGEEGQVHHVGSEKRKAQFIEHMSRGATIGWLEDKPHKAGKILVPQLQISARDRGPYRNIVLGVAPHPHARNRMARLANDIEGFRPEIIIKKRTDGSLNVAGWAFGLRVVPIDSYSGETGREFAQTVLAA
jgi:hypothetical protein